MRRLLLLIGLIALLAPAAPAAAARPPVKHVFVIVLENKDFDVTFGPGSQSPYLSKTLANRGQLLTQYYGIGHHSLDNYIAMVSGQPPTDDTQDNCPTYRDVLPGTIASVGMAVGQGCVYPPAVKTIADQLTAKRFAWKGYMEDMGTSCRHPAPYTTDNTREPRPNDQYAAKHNPFVYFHSLLDTGACAKNNVDLSRWRTPQRGRPSFTFITPDLCHDAHESSCPDGGPGGLPAADSFLRTWVPRIMRSPAYAEGGLLVITFDEAESGDAACCNEQPGYNTQSPGQGGPGGGRTGTVLLSRFVKRGVNSTPYNHYSLLRSFEDIFGVRHLGLAGQSGLKAFGSDVYKRR